MIFNMLQICIFIYFYSFTQAKITISIPENFTTFINERLKISQSYIESASLFEPGFPVVINTWAFYEAGKKAWAVLSSPNGKALDAVEQGCSECERLRCHGTVGFGGSPDESGETTLDALIFDGEKHDVGAVGDLRNIKSAISVARYVMERTTHSMLVGDQAMKFALSMGFRSENLSTPDSNSMYMKWKDNNCQPNFWKNVSPDPSVSCGPYQPIDLSNGDKNNLDYGTKSPLIDSTNHDTIGMIALDAEGRIAAGTSTNGARHKIPGRVGDSPIPGSGAYVDKNVGGAAATGDGDVMMRFLPALVTVEGMRSNLSPSLAASRALERIVPFYPLFSGAVVALDTSGIFGAACVNLPEGAFNYTVADESGIQIHQVDCINSLSTKEESLVMRFSHST